MSVFFQLFHLVLAVAVLRFLLSAVSWLSATADIELHLRIQFCGTSPSAMNGSIYLYICNFVLHCICIPSSCLKCF